MPGRPRSEEARLATLHAAGELLLEKGLADASMDAIAERAGVSKATIYRWWPSKEMLALDALFTDWSGPLEAVPDTGSLRGDLLANLGRWARLNRRHPYARVIAALVAEAHSNPVFMEHYRREFVEVRRGATRVLLRRAIERGELSPEADVELALDCLYGPLYHRLLNRHRPLSEAFVRGVIDVVLAGLR